MNPYLTPTHNCDRKANYLITTSNACELVANAISTLLKSGNTIVVPTSTEKAIDSLKDQCFDYIIIEENLDNIDGWRFARLIRNTCDKNRDAKIIIIIDDMPCGKVSDTAAQSVKIDKTIHRSELAFLSSLCSELSTKKPPVSSILVVEDDKDIARLINRKLGKDYKLTFADDGITGERLALTNEYDLILLDLALPGKSGNEILEAVHKANPRQTVVVMTAHGSPDVGLQILKSGAIEFLMKPFELEQLAATVASIGLSKQLS